MGMLAGALAVLYSVCLVISFGISVKYVNSEYESEMQEMEQYLENVFLSARNVTSQEIACGMSLDWDSSYPWKLYIVNTDGEIVEESGNWICFMLNSVIRYINMDEYLTDGIKQELYEALQSAKSGKIRISQIDLGYRYTNEGDKKIVPAAIYVKDALDDSVNKKIAISDIHTASTVKELESYENKDFKIRSNFTESGLKQYECFDLQLDQMKQDVWALLEYGSMFYPTESYFNQTTEGIWQSYFDVAIDHEECMVCLMSTHNSRGEALQSSVFHTAVLTQTVLFGIVGAVILIASAYIYEKNRRLEEARQSFTSAAAHELKTPLSIIQNQCECILEQIAPEKNIEYVSSIYGESLRMNKLVMSFLQYNRLVSVEKIEMDEIDFTELVKREAEKYRIFMKEKNILLNVNLQKDIVIKCNEELITLAIDNLLMNAVKYCPREGIVTIQLQSQGSRPRFSVTNTCSELKEEDLKKIWDVLYRRDQARNSRDDSTGMGLPITKQILKRHHMRYGCEKVKGGVKFWFDFPYSQKRETMKGIKIKGIEKKPS